MEAHHIKDISGSNPLERYAILRLLIAFAMDMLHPETSYDRMDLLQTGHFDADSLDKYIRECEKDGPRFDLFDPDHPFLQSKYDEAMDSKAKKPIATILHALPSGNNHIFIDHRLADSHSISIPDAFHALCAAYVFCVSGTAGPSSVNNTPPLYTVMIGGTDSPTGKSHSSFSFACNVYLAQPLHQHAQQKAGRPGGQRGISGLYRPLHRVRADLHSVWLLFSGSIR